MSMIKNIINQFIKLFGQEYLGDWDAIQNLTINSVTSPEILLKNVPFPEKLFELAELPFEIIYSNIKSLRIKFHWSSIFSNNVSPINICANDLFLVIKFSYPSLWDTNKIINHQYKLKKNKLDKWDSINISKEKKEDNFLKSLPIKLVNSLRILVKNIKIVFFDNYIHKNPFTFEFFIKSFKIDELNKYNVKLTEEEKKNIKKNLLINIWIRFIGLHILFKEYKKKIKYKKQLKKKKNEQLYNSEKAGHNVPKSKDDNIEGKEEYFLTAIENLFSESGSSVYRNKKKNWKKGKKKTSFNSHEFVKGVFSFSDYEINERIKDGYLKKRSRRNMRSEKFGKNMSLKKYGGKHKKSRKKSKNNYNFEIPKHDLGFRITSKDGLDMHVIFKKYDIKALNELKSDIKCFKHLELSLVKHNKDDTDDDICNNVKMEEEENIKGSCYCYNYGNSNIEETKNDSFFISSKTNEHEENNNICNSELRNYDEIMEECFRNDYPPMFNDISTYENLNIFFTTSALDAFYNFIRYIEFSFLYKGGCSKIFNIIPSIENCIKYSEYRKLRNEKNYIYNENTEDFLKKFESSCPIHLLTKLRLLSDECIYSKEYFNNAHLKKREWKKLLYNFIKKQKGVTSSIIDENLDKLEKWFSHDMLFNFVIPQINFTYIPIKFNHFSNSNVKNYKCLLSYSVSCSFLFKQEKFSTIKKKIGIYLHNMNINSLFVLFKKNNKCTMNNKKYCINYVEKLPIINSCLYNEPNNNSITFYHYDKANVGDDYEYSVERIHSNEERIIAKNIAHMTNGMTTEVASQSNAQKDGCDYYMKNSVSSYYNNETRGTTNGNTFSNNTLQRKNNGNQDIIAQNERNDNENNVKTCGKDENEVSKDSHDTIKELNNNRCQKDLKNYNMCNIFERYQFHKNSFEKEEMEKIKIENLRSLENEHLKNECEKVESNNNIDDVGNNRKGFWKFILGNQKKESTNNMNKNIVKSIDDNNFDRIINNQIVLIPNTLIILINDYSNNIREIDITVSKYIINVNNLFPLMNFIPTNNICLELFLKYDNYIDKDVIECICLCISKSVMKKKIVRIHMDEVKSYFFNSLYVENEIVNLRNFLNKTRRRKKTRGSPYCHEKFIEHDLLVDPFKSVGDDNEEEMKKINRNKHLDLSIEKNDYIINNNPQCSSQNSYNQNEEVNNDSMSDDVTSSTCQHSDKEHGQMAISCSHGNKIYRNKSMEHFVLNQEMDITNMYNIIFNNLFVAQTNVYHTKVNNTFSYLRKQNFLYSIRNKYYMFLRRYIQYNINRKKAQNGNLLSIGIFCHLKNLFLFQNKIDSLLYLSVHGVEVEHLFHPSFVDLRSIHSYEFKNDVEQSSQAYVDSLSCKNSYYATNSKENCSSISLIGSSEKINNESKNHSRKRNRIIEYSKNKNMLISIKSLKLKKNENVLSLKVNILNCSINEIFVSLFGICKHIIPLEHIELLKARINKLKRIKQHLIANNKNTMHLKNINVTNDLLYKTLNKYNLSNPVRDKDTNNDSNVENNENELTVNRNYEKYIKKLVIKILDHEKILYSKEDFEKIFYMILRKKVTRPNNGNNNQCDKKELLHNLSMDDKKGKIIHHNSDMLYSFSSNNDIVENYYTPEKEEYDNPIRNSKCMEKEYYTCKDDTMLSKKDYNENCSSHNNSDNFNIIIGRNSYSTANEIGDDDKYKIGRLNEGNRIQEKFIVQEQNVSSKDIHLDKPSIKYLNEHCKYMNLRNLFNYNDLMIDTMKINENDVFIHSSISNDGVTEMDSSKNNKMQEKDKSPKRSRLFFLLINQINIAITNKNEGLFKIVCNEFMGELTNMTTVVNISIKTNTLYFFYVMTVLSRHKGMNVTKKCSKRYPITFKNENSVDSMENNNCKKYVILTDSISNMISVSKSNMKKKKKVCNFFNDYICILKRKKFKLFIDYDKKKRINSQPQIHLDLYINKETNKKIVKLSLTNFNFFYSSTLFVLLNNVIINFFLTYIQEKEKVRILLCRFDSIVRNRGSAYVTLATVKPFSSLRSKVNDINNISAKCTKKKDKIVVNSLEKWVSSHEVVDTLCTSNNESFLDETYADNHMNCGTCEYKITGNGLPNADDANLTNKTFYYEFSENEKNVQKNILHQNGISQNTSFSGVTAAKMKENISNSLWNGLYYGEKMSSLSRRKNILDDKNEICEEKKKFIDTRSSGHGLMLNVNSNDNLNSAIKIDSQKDKKKSLNFLNEHKKKDVICKDISFASFNYTESEECKEMDEKKMIKNDDNNMDAHITSVQDEGASNNTCSYNLSKSYHTPLSANNLDKYENFHIESNREKNSMNHKTVNVYNNVINTNVLRTIVPTGSGSKCTENRKDENKTTDKIRGKNEKICKHILHHKKELSISKAKEIRKEDIRKIEESHESEEISLFVCSQNVNICYLVNYHRFKYMYKENNKVDAYMNDYMNFIDSCSNYCKYKNKQGENYDHVGIMNKDLYNLNLNFLFKLEYACSKNKKKTINAFFPFLYIILMKNCNYIISHLTIVDVKFSALFWCKREKCMKKKKKKN